MIQIKKLLYTPIGKIFISIILGFGLATLFHKVCNERDCLQFHGPILQDVNEKIFRTDNKCYKYTPTAETCNSDKKKIIEMEYITPDNTKNYEALNDFRAVPNTITEVQKTAKLETENNGWSFSNIITSFMGKSTPTQPAPAQTTLIQ